MCNECIYREGEATQGEQYGNTDITEALNETVDSMANTTVDAEITQDSVAM